MFDEEKRGFRVIIVILKLSAHSEQGTILSNLHVLVQSLQQPSRVSTIIIFILLMRKLAQRGQVTCLRTQSSSLPKFSSLASHVFGDHPMPPVVF